MDTVDDTQEMKLELPVCATGTGDIGDSGRRDANDDPSHNHTPGTELSAYSGAGGHIGFDSQESSGCVIDEQHHHEEYDECGNKRGTDHYDVFISVGGKAVLTAWPDEYHEFEKWSIRETTYTSEYNETADCWWVPDNAGSTEDTSGASSSLEISGTPGALDSCTTPSRPRYWHTEYSCTAVFRSKTVKLTVILEGAEGTVTITYGRISHTGQNSCSVTRDYMCERLIDGTYSLTRFRVEVTVTEECMEFDRWDDGYDGQRSRWIVAEAAGEIVIHAYAKPKTINVRYAIIPAEAGTIEGRGKSGIMQVRCGHPVYLRAVITGQCYTFSSWNVNGQTIRSNGISAYFTDTLNPYAYAYAVKKKVKLRLKTFFSTNSGDNCSVSGGYVIVSWTDYFGRKNAILKPDGDPLEFECGTKIKVRAISDVPCYKFSGWHSGVPSLSTTSPFTICWASAGNEPMTNINAIAKNCFKGFFLIE